MPQRPVIALLGDAAFAMTGMEVHTAAEHGVPVIWIVLNNAGNAMVANIQHMLGFNVASALYQTPIDARTVAAGLGVASSTVTTLAEFERALTTAIEHDTAWLIDVRVDPDETPWSLRGRAAVLSGTPPHIGQETS
jgi:acetolactate synthase-1/2/3 large subunit